MIRVLLVDDHLLFRQGIRHILSLEPDIQVVGEVGDGEEVFPLLASLRPDVVVLDLSMPVTSGTEVLRRLVEQEARVSVVILSMYEAGHFAMHLINQGAGAYLTKDDSSDELVRAIRAVVDGGTYLTDRVRAERGRADPERPLHAKLSPREFQVFTRLTEGAGVSEIAVELEVHISTVSTLVSRIKTKLGVGSVGEIVSYAHRVGFSS